MNDRLARLIAAEIDTPAADEVQVFANALWRDGASAVLFYGSGLWKAIDEDTMLDFYVLCDDLAAYGLPFVSRVAARVLPPNVYYRELAWQGRTLRAKVAVMRLDDFIAGTKGWHATPQIWARFCQPCRLLRNRDATTHDRVVAALAEAVRHFHRETRPLLSAPFTLREFWAAGFAATYGYELRSESTQRGSAIYDAHADAFDARSAEAMPTDISHPPGSLRARQWRGKAIHFLRLAKASFTFSGGVDYLLWKIARHSGVTIKATPFQRRHPLIGGWSLLWKIYRRGGFR